MTTPLDDAYAQFVLSRMKIMESHEADLMHAAVGIAGEAGELLDTVKKTWVYGKILDTDNLIEELGDLEFYMQAMRGLIRITREQVLEANITKLIKRYPVGYTDKAAQARADKAELRKCPFCGVTLEDPCGDPPLDGCICEKAMEYVRS